MVRVVFLHPDLGIGGAERLVVDAALALKAKNHEVTIVTAHHDSSHCFSETSDGQIPVIAVGDWLPRAILGRFFAFCATLRMMYAAFYICLFSDLKPDVIVADQVSNSIPILKLCSRAKIIFYCHFPDQLLTDRKTFWKRAYRKVMDSLEEVTTRMADLILVNSLFTSGVFRKTFTTMRHVTPSVLYPSLNTDMFDRLANQSDDEKDGCFTFLSINRYERKKNIRLALEAFANLMQQTNDDSLKLIVAGGYDYRVSENVEHFKELRTLANYLNISANVEFLRSPSDDKKVALLQNSDCLIYTPSGEHFGIVPLEAMYNQLPVIAVNDGGPTETVVDGETGYLRRPTCEDFAEAMTIMHQGGIKLKEKLGQNGRKRVMQHFSFVAFAEKLDEYIKSVL